MNERIYQAENNRVKSRDLKKILAEAIECGHGPYDKLPTPVLQKKILWLRQWTNVLGKFYERSLFAGSAVKNLLSMKDVFENLYDDEHITLAARAMSSSCEGNEYHGFFEMQRDKARYLLKAYDLTQDLSYAVDAQEFYLELTKRSPMGSSIFFLSRFEEEVLERRIPVLRQTLFNEEGSFNRLHANFSSIQRVSAGNWDRIATVALMYIQESRSEGNVVEEEHGREVLRSACEYTGVSARNSIIRELYLRPVASLIRRAMLDQKYYNFGLKRP